MKVEPREEFKRLSEREVLQAVDDDAENPVAAEVVRLMSGYMDNFKAECDRIGRIPEDISTLKPRWPIEDIAKRLTTKVIREGLMQVTK